MSTEGFDVGWTTTTEGERFAASREIARERLAQLFESRGVRTLVPRRLCPH